MTKSGRKWLLVAVLALLAYPVLGTAALSTGLLERLVRSKDLKVEIQNPAWTLWPGHFHVAGARVLVNGDTQFKLEAKNLLVHMWLLPLVKKHLRVTMLKADDARYWMRVQVKSPKGIERRIAAYPELNDLPGNPTLFEKEAERTEQRKGDFTVEVDGIDVGIAELWFMEYHYIGPGRLNGSFLVGPSRMRVGTSVQNLGPGELRFGPTEPVLSDFRGRIEATIPDINPEEHADAGFLELVTSNIQLAGTVVSVAPLTAYTGRIRLVNGRGSFDSRLLLSNGRLGKESHIAYSTEKIGVRGKGFGVDTDWNVDARVAEATDASESANDPSRAPAPPPGDHGQQRAPPTAAPVLPRIHSKSRVTYVSFANEHHEIFTIQLHGHEHEVVLSSNQLGRMTDIDHARIRFPKIMTTDLRDLAALSAERGPVESKAGDAHASLALDIDHHHVARGQFDANFTGVQFTAAEIDVSGQGAVRGRIQADLDHESMNVRDVSVTLTDVGMRAGKEEVRGFWTRAEVPYLAAWGLPPKRIEGRLSMRARSAEPLLKGLAAKHEISSLVPRLTNLPDLRIRATLRKKGDVTDVMLEPLENELFDVAGRFYSKGNESRFAFVVGGKAVSLGIAKKTGEGTTLMPYAREGWLNSELRDFPKPLEEVHSSQP